jgi:hypothetical protein|nr:MAG TPA: hypothetical protein [Caudoviricetes sp.]
MDFHEDMRRRLKSIRESILKEKNTINVNVDKKEKVKDNGKKRRKKKRK